MVPSGRKSQTSTTSEVEGTVELRSHIAWQFHRTLSATTQLQTHKHPGAPRRQDRWGATVGKMSAGETLFVPISLRTSASSAEAAQTANVVDSEDPCHLSQFQTRSSVLSIHSVFVFMHAGHARTSPAEPPTPSQPALWAAISLVPHT